VIKEEAIMRTSTILLTFFLLIICSVTVQARIIHVPGDSTTIQGGINGASAGDTVMVHPGTYYEHGIDLHGKAVTVMGTDPEDSSVVAATVVNGDSLEEGNFLGSVFVFQTNEDSMCILAGLTIANGNANIGGGIYCYDSSPVIIHNIISGNSANYYGGGMYNSYSSPTVINCTFSENSSDSYGGGMYNDNSSPTVINCTFSGNSAYVYNYGAGGGMYNSSSSPTVTNCTFIGNSSWAVGGGMCNQDSSPTVTNCTFIENRVSTYHYTTGGGMYNFSGSSPTVSNCTFIGNSAQYGGGIGNSEGSPTISNCTFSGNLAYEYGGGMDNFRSSPTVTNCTFSENGSGYAGGMNNDYSSPMVTNCTFTGNSSKYDFGGGMRSYSGTPTVINCIFWANIEGEIVGSAVVTYSDVAGGYDGEGNIDADPMFITFKAYDYLLESGSPCIDTGDPSIEDGFDHWSTSMPYESGPRSDMGAYGGPGNVGWLPNYSQ
jgi:hypothetical protein